MQNAIEPIECRCACHYSNFAMMHITACCEGSCPVCGMWIKRGLKEHIGTHSRATTEFDRWLAGWTKWRSELAPPGGIAFGPHKPSPDMIEHLRKLGWSVRAWQQMPAPQPVEQPPDSEMLTMSEMAERGYTLDRDSICGDSGTSMDTTKTMLPINHLIKTLDRCCGEYEILSHSSSGMQFFQAKILQVATGEECVVTYGNTWESGGKLGDFLANRLNGLTRDDSGLPKIGDVYPELPADFDCVPEPMEEAFKAGVWVVCLRSQGSKQYLEVGSLYTVDSIHHGEPVINNRAYPADWFRRARPDEIPQPVKPAIKAPSDEWLREMAEKEDGKCISVGGLAVDLGMYKKPEADEPSHPVHFRDGVWYWGEWLLEHEAYAIERSGRYLQSNSEHGSGFTDRIRQTWTPSQMATINASLLVGCKPVLITERVPPELPAPSPADAPPTLQQVSIDNKTDSNRQLQLREGAWYERRDGKVVGPAMVFANEKYPWIAAANTYTDSGRFWVIYGESRLDLIREVPPPQTELKFSVEDFGDVVKAKLAESEPQPDSEGWIEHDGNGCPVPLNTEVEVRLADGETGFTKLWGRVNPLDIVAYRIVPPIDIGPQRAMPSSPEKVEAQSKAIKRELESLPPSPRYSIDAGPEMETRDEKLESILAQMNGAPDMFRECVGDPRKVLARICRTAHWVAKRKKVPEWSIICKWTGHGSGVSAAIYEYYREDAVEVSK